MKTLHKVDMYTIGGFPCCHLDKNDKVLSGEHGEIRELGNTNQYTALISIPGGDEMKIVFDFKDLLEWKKFLGIPMSPTLQLPYADDPNLRTPYEIIE